jgi:hypothetical protein
VAQGALQSVLGQLADCLKLLGGKQGKGKKKQGDQALGDHGGAGSSEHRRTRQPRRKPKRKPKQKPKHSRGKHGQGAHGHGGHGGHGDHGAHHDAPEADGAEGRSGAEHGSAEQQISHAGGDEGRVYADRGAARGGSEAQDQQEVDPAATDTWLGAGEGIKNFSDVFGAFLPAEGAVKASAAGGHAGHGGHGGHAPDLHHAEVVTHDVDGADPEDDASDQADGSAAGGEAGGDGESGAGGPDEAGEAGEGAQGGRHRSGRRGSRRGPKRGKGQAPWLRKLGGLGGKLGRFGKAGKFAQGLIGKVTGAFTGKGFFGKLFGSLSGFADKISGWAKLGAGLLGKGMHFAELGMGALNKVGDLAGTVQKYAGKSEGFLDQLGLHKLAGYAGKIGGAAGWVGDKAETGHSWLQKADQLMGQGKKGLGTVDRFAGRAGKAFDQAGRGSFGGLLHLFKASRSGDGVDGRTTPERFRPGGNLDDPRALDVTTLSRMEGFLGGSFTGVKIHTGPGAAEVTRRYDAEAVTVKDHIFFAPGRFNPASAEGQKLLAHELTHVMQAGRPNLDVRTAEGEALQSEHSYGAGPEMRPLNLGKPPADFRLADGDGAGASTGVHTAKRSRSKGQESGAKDEMPDGDELLELVSTRVYEMLMEELEQAFESR